MKKIIIILIVFVFSTPVFAQNADVKNLISKMNSNPKKKGVKYYGVDSLAARAGNALTKVIVEIKRNERFQISFNDKYISILRFTQDNSPSIFVVDKNEDGKVDFVQYNGNIMYNAEDTATSKNEVQVQKEYLDIVNKLTEFYNK